MSAEVAPYVALGTGIVALIILLVGIRQARREAVATALAPLLAVGMTVLGTLLYVVVSGVPLNPAVVAAMAVAGFAAGLLEGRSVALYRRNGLLLRRGGSGYLVAWGAGYLLTLAAGQSAYAALHAAAVLVMVAGAGWAVGSDGLLLVRIARSRGQPVLVPAAATAGPAQTPASAAAFGPPMPPPSALGAARGTVAPPRAQAGPPRTFAPTVWQPGLHVAPSVPPAHPGPRLVLAQGQASAVSVPLPGGGFVSVGRDPTSTLVLNDPWASPRHAWLEVRAGRWEVVDAGSLNGTWLNGARVARAPLRHGDRIGIGQSVLLYVEGA